MLTEDTKRLAESQEFGLCFHSIQSSSNINICTGKEKGKIIIMMMKTIIVTDTMGWKDPSMEKICRPEF